MDMERVRQLEEELKALQGEVVDPEVANPKGLYLSIHGEDFECRRVGTTWQMMLFSKARQAASIHIPRDPGHAKDCECPQDRNRRALEEKKNEAGMVMLAAMHDTAMVLLKPYERDRFRMFMAEESMSDAGIEPGELEEAIGKVIAAAGGQDEESGGKELTDKPHSGRIGETVSRPSPPSYASSRTASETAPVDLWQKDTAEVATQNGNS